MWEQGYLETSHLGASEHLRAFGITWGNLAISKSIWEQMEHLWASVGIWAHLETSGGSESTGSIWEHLRAPKGIEEHLIASGGSGVIWEHLGAFANIWDDAAAPDAILEASGNICKYPGAP